MLMHGTEQWIPVNLRSDASNNEKHGSNKQEEFWANDQLDAQLHYIKHFLLL